LRRTEKRKHYGQIESYFWEATTNKRDHHSSIFCYNDSEGVMTGRNIALRKKENKKGSAFVSTTY
jgi:hypothetical protein